VEKDNDGRAPHLEEMEPEAEYLSARHVRSGKMPTRSRRRVLDRPLSFLVEYGTRAAGLDLHYPLGSDATSTDQTVRTRRLR
jgi:hypothetical protein